MAFCSKSVIITNELSANLFSVGGLEEIIPIEVKLILEGIINLPG